MPHEEVVDPEDSIRTGEPVRGGLEDRLARMIRAQTVSADLAKTGAEPFEQFHRLLAELYPLVHEHLEREVVDELGLLFKWSGRSHADPVVLMGHYDTVAADLDDPWSRPPFSGDVDDGAVWGRGTLDDKGPLCVLLEAVENLLANGFEPERDIYLVSGGDEEVSGNAARAVAGLFRARGIVPWLVLDEGGAVIEDPLPRVTVPSAMIGVAEKGNVTVRVTASAVVGHASSPSKQLSPLERIARAVERARRVRFPARLSEATQTMFRLYGSRTSGLAKAATVLAPRAAKLSAYLLSQLGGEAAATVRTTVVATTLEAGTTPNMLPSHASATFSLDVALNETTDDAVARLRRGLRDPHLAFEVLSARQPSPQSRHDNAQWELLARAVKQSYPGTPAVPYVSLGGTDSRHFHPQTPEATYRFAPLAMSSGQRLTVHGVDEHVTVDALLRGERFYRALIRSIPSR